MTKTKIVCTIGPACWDEETLADLIREGMDVARLNFSHGDHEGHRKVHDRIRKVAKLLKTEVAIMQDLGGPKIRLGEIPGDGFSLEEGAVVALTGEETESTPERLHVSYHDLARDLKTGEPVLIDDGLVQLEVQKIQGPDAICRVTVGGVVRSNKGVNLPSSDLSISALTEKDKKDAHFGVELGVDFIALSFVRKPSDIQELRQIIESRDRFIPIIAKIEKQEAVNNLDEILTAADGAMVARGDLGIETPIERVPLIQKDIIKRCNEISKPVITATQMLDSMIRNPLPTRAEVTDIANAILDGTDAVMLSGETASGKYPVQAVKTMDRICTVTEEKMMENPLRDYPSHHNVVDSISEATYNISEELEAKGILVLTDSGRTARLVSRYKPDAPIIAITYSLESLRRMKLSWGVFPKMVKQTPSTDKMLENANNAALESGIVKGGDLVVTTAGIPAMVKGSTNMIKVEVLGAVFLRGNGAGPETKVTGKVCPVNDAEEARKVIERGDIMITRRLDDSFLNVTKRIGGVITEEGGPGSYGEYFCDKFDIPGILGVPGAMESFFCGQILTMETDRGIIYGPKS